MPASDRWTDIFVPPEQVIDTVDLYFIKARQRRLSLKFLTWFVLGENIQTDTHDSIEDARSALRLYKAYHEFEEDGTFDEKLEELYREGKANVCLPCGKVRDAQLMVLSSPITELEAACFCVASTGRGTCPKACDTREQIQLFRFSNRHATKPAAVIHGIGLQLPGYGVEWYESIDGVGSRVACIQRELMYLFLHLLHRVRRAEEALS